MAQERKLTDKQIIGVVKQLRAGRTAAEMAREIGVSTLRIPAKMNADSDGDAKAFRAESE